MSTIHFRLPERDRTASEAFSGLPAPILEEVKKGFGALAKFDVKRYDELLNEVRESFLTQRSIKEGEVASRLGIPPELAGSVMSAAGITAFALTTSKIKAQDFVDAGVKAGAITEADKAGIFTFVKAVESHSSKVSHALKVSRITSEGIPLLDDLEISVDVRLSFEKDAIGVAVPVAIMRMTTVIDEGLIYLQLRKQDVERVIEEFQTALRQLQQAEEWIRQHPSSPK